MTWQRTPELADKICERLENGESLRKICDSEGIPSRSTVLKWLREDDEFNTKCARAREAQGEFYADQLDDINELLLDGTLDPAAARVVSSNLQWKASKLASKKYGDKMALTDGDGGNLVLNVLTGVPRSPNE